MSHHFLPASFLWNPSSLSRHRTSPGGQHCLPGLGLVPSHPSGLVRYIVCPVNGWLFKTPIHHILTLFKTLRHLLCTHRMTSKPLAWPRSPYSSPHLSLSTSWQKCHSPAVWAACSHLPPFAYLKLFVTVLEFSHNVPCSLCLSWITDTLNCIIITHLWIGLYSRPFVLWTRYWVIFTFVLCSLQRTWHK